MHDWSAAGNARKVTSDAGHQVRVGCNDMAAETIIESFCERCGTRYSFEPVRKRESKLVGIGKSLGILPDDQGPSVAARDPFHGTFHFCLECRQYTCPSCWNEDAGFCVGCVPLPDAPDTAALDAAEAAATMEAASYMDLALAEQAVLGTPAAWPDADLHRRRMDTLEVGAAALVVDTATRPVDHQPDEDDSWSLTLEPGTPSESAVSDGVGTEDPGSLDAGAVDHGHDRAVPAVATAIVLDTVVDESRDAVVDLIQAEAATRDVVADQAAEPEAVADQAAEPEAVADQAAEPEAQPTGVAYPGVAGDAGVEAGVEAGADQTSAASLSPEPVAAAIAVAAAAAAAGPDDDLEADWADLLRHLPAEDDVVPDDWAAMAPSLGPDIAPAPVPAPMPPPAPPEVHQPPAAQPATTTSPWQLTAPAPDAEARPTAWPPLGPVFRPLSTTEAAPPALHPSVMARHPAPRGVLARGQQAGAPAQLPKGVRPCVSCELPLSASAHFCRRCGRPQA